jgi:hypothetical protein
MSRLAYSRDATRFFPEQNVGPEHPLATPGSHKLIPECRSDDVAVNNRRFDIGRLRRGLKNGDRRVRVPVRLSDEADQSIGECLRELCKVDGLQTVTALLKR